jgi:hypothetical protein
MSHQRDSYPYDKDVGFGKLNSQGRDGSQSLGKD